MYSRAASGGRALALQACEAAATDVWARGSAAVLCTGEVPLVVGMDGWPMAWRFKHVIMLGLYMIAARFSGTKRIDWRELPGTRGARKRLHGARAAKGHMPAVRRSQRLCYVTPRRRRRVFADTTAMITCIASLTVRAGVRACVVPGCWGTCIGLSVLPVGLSATPKTQ